MINGNCTCCKVESCKENFGFFLKHNKLATQKVCSKFFRFRLFEKRCVAEEIKITAEKNVKQKLKTNC